MGISSLITLCLISFVVGAVSISMGGTSLITVPVMISMGMASKNAVATNMFALVFLSISGAVGFGSKMKTTHRKMIVLFCMLTVCGSLLGARLMLAIDKDLFKNAIAVIIGIIAVSFLFNKDLGTRGTREGISKPRFFISAVAIFILGIYGGFFSGGYVILLSYVLILAFGLDFLQTAFITKVFNIFSSLAACLVFSRSGLIDFSVGIPFAFSMSLGAFGGAKLAVIKGNLWIRNLFVIFAIVLAVKLLVF